MPTGEIPLAAPVSEGIYVERKLAGFPRVPAGGFRDDKKGGRHVLYAAAASFLHPQGAINTIQSGRKKKTAADLRVAPVEKTLSLSLKIISF